MDVLLTFFYIISIDFNSLVPVRSKSVVYPLFYQFDEFYTCSHFLSNLFIASTPFSMGSLRASKKWKSEEVRFRPFGGWGRTDYQSFLLAYLLCFQTCACFLVEGGFQHYFCEVQLSRNTSAWL